MNIKEIATLVCAEFGSDVAGVLSPCRKHRTIFVRRVVVYIAHEHGIGFKEIGEQLNRNQGTVSGTLRRWISHEPNRQKIEAFIDRNGLRAEPKVSPAYWHKCECGTIGADGDSPVKAWVKMEGWFMTRDLKTLCPKCRPAEPKELPIVRPRPYINNLRRFSPRIEL